jgi:acetyltransferase
MKAMRALLDPKAVAVVGASQRRGRGTNVIANLRDCGFAGEIFAVNPRYQDVLGYKCFPTVSDLPASVDCLAVAVAADAACDVLDEAHARGITRPSSLQRASGKAGTGMPVPRGCGRSRSKGCASAGQTVSVSSA